MTPHFGVTATTLLDRATREARAAMAKSRSMGHIDREGIGCEIDRLLAAVVRGHEIDHSGPDDARREHAAHLGALATALEKRAKEAMLRIDCPELIPHGKGPREESEPLEFQPKRAFDDAAYGVSGTIEKKRKGRASSDAGHGLFMGCQDLPPNKP